MAIRTNGGTLTVNAENDTVKHYGNAKVVTLTAVSSNSYYEHGVANLVDIKNGRLVITNDASAEVGTIYLTATNNEYNGIILATQNGSELPEVVARESVDLPTGEAKKLVVTIQTNVNAEGQNPTKIEEIYLYPASDVKEATNGYNVSDLGLLVVEAISSSARTQAEEQLAGKGEAVINKVKEEKTQDISGISTGALYYAGGNGSAKSPYLISNAEELNNVRQALDANFKLTNDIDMSGVTNWTPIGNRTEPFSGKLDGGNYSIKKWSNNSKALFGVIRGTNNDSLTGVREDALDDDNNLITENVSEDNYTCVIKNINIDDSELVLNAYMGGFASVIIDAYVENIDVKNCRIRYDSGWYTGIVFGEAFKSHIKSVHLSGTNIITSADNPSYIGNTGLIIGGISGSTTESILTKDYLKRSDMHFRTIIDNCVNDASATINKTYDLGFLGGVVGCIYSRQSDEVIIDCVNNGNITINNMATKLSVSGVCGVHMGGGKINIIRCVNTGDIKVIGNPSLSGTNGYDQLSGIASYANGPFIDCLNSGNLSGNVKFIGGICAQTSSNESSTFVNCSNTGYLTSSNPEAAIADICGSSSASFTNISASAINNGGVSAYKIRLTETASATGTMIVPSSAGIIEVVDSSFGFDSIDLSNVSGTVEFRVSNANVSLLGDNPNASVSFIGDNNTITVGEGVTLGNIKLEGTDNSIENNGTIGHLNITNSSLTSVNNGNVDSVQFSGDNSLEMSFVNNGIIGVNNEKWHSVQTQTQVNLTFNNNGTIYGSGSKYGLLFYGMSDVTFNAGADSRLVIEDPLYTAVFYNGVNMRANTVTFNVASGAEGLSGNSYYGITTHLSGGMTQVTVNVE